MASDEVDTSLGANYRLVEKLGRGATGEVWRGVDRRTDQPVAAKLLHAEHVEDADLIERFLRERTILTGLRHESIVAVRDLVVEGDRLAIVMEYVDGGSLRRVLTDSGPLPPQLALGVVAAVLDGLTVAHERSILHRDLKPDNVLLSKGWRELRPGTIKLSDFGISRIVAEGARTTTGLVGTPEYMAPEQLVSGVGEFPADVYGAGILLYEALAGRTPYAGEGTGYSVAHRHVTSRPPQLDLPDPLWTIVEALIDKDPQRRPTARMAANQLRRLQPTAAGVAALPAQRAPGKFEAAAGAATEVRGLQAPASEKAVTGTAASPEDEAAPTPADPPVPLPDLGAPSSQTMVRAMPTLERPAVTVAPGAAPEPKRDRRRPVLIASIAAGAVLIAGGAFWISRGLAGPPPPTQTSAVFRAQQQSQARPTGLGISRVATWSQESQSADLTITYSSQRSGLAGPFLESIPGPAGSSGCPDVEWTAGAGKVNQPSVTGVRTTCGWTVTTTPIEANQTVSATATVKLALTGDPASALQTWLDGVAKATEAASTNSEVTSTAYAAQRLADVAVVAPSRTVSGRTLRLTLQPVWPSGADALNPLLQSPPTGEPSSVLVAVAGGEGGVRFSDGCSGGLTVSGNGLVVTAAAPADQCQVNARVGNFTDLASNTFSITTRGS